MIRQLASSVLLCLAGLAACGGRPLPYASYSTDDGGGRDLISAAPDQMGTACAGPWVPPSGVACAGNESCDDGNPCTYSDACVAGVCRGRPREDCRPCRNGADCCGGSLVARECSLEHTYVEYALGACDTFTGWCQYRLTADPCQ